MEVTMSFELNNLFSLKDKVALVTGGAGHLGTSISEILADAGAEVFIASHNKEKCVDLATHLEKKYNRKSQGLFLDISSEESVKKCVSDVFEYKGAIDILINNAYFGANGNIEGMAEKEWEKGIDGTINGVFRCTKAVLPNMIVQKRGVIINIASMYGVVAPNPEIYGDSGLNNPPNYGAGKAAIIQFTKYIGCHYGNKGIRANSISPGPFPNQEVQKNKEFIDELSKKNPLGRIGQPDELKGAVVYLASNASSFVTGQNLCVDGGWTSW